MWYHSSPATSRAKSMTRTLFRQRIGYRTAPQLMSRLRKAWVLFRHPHADISFGARTYLGPGFSLHAPFGGTFRVGDDVEFRRGFRAELTGPDATIAIGDGSVFTYDVIIQCSTTIDVGKRCIFGQASLVVDGNHRFRDLDRPLLEQGYDFRPLTIADDAMVATKCTIIADLGERCFVGANTLVTRPVAAFTVVGGNPAQELEYFGPERG